MKILNNTENELSYNVSWEGGGDCGVISPGETTDDSSWDGENIAVTIQALPTEPDNSSGPFSVTIPETNTGMAVTIGLYQE